MDIPIPKNYWPQWAFYLTVAPDGEVKFWQNNPSFLNGRWVVRGGKRVSYGYLPAQNKEIWKR